uniref:Uncharacterized protein MANES_02G220500 n=1 Tax=Rhizophora mucronata TaxID=61149 RepID=A0A2P2JKK8_RHIMU
MTVKIVLTCKGPPVVTQDSIKILRKVHTRHCITHSD